MITASDSKPNKGIFCTIKKTFNCVELNACIVSSILNCLDKL